MDGKTAEEEAVFSPVKHLWRCIQNASDDVGPDDAERTNDRRCASYRDLDLIEFAWNMELFVFDDITQLKIRTFIVLARV